MFKKLVTNLPYSPGLLNQIGFYSKRLSQEEFSRRVGMIFAVLAMILNINLVYFGPEASVLASPGNDVITGGVYGSTAREIQDKTIAAYKNSATTRAIFDYYKVTEADIRGTTLTTLNTADTSLRSVGRQSFGRGGEVCQTHQGVYFCERSMYAAYNYKSLNVRAITGIRAAAVGSSDPWFSIIESCGNIVVRVGGEEDIEVTKKLTNQIQTADVGDEVTFRLTIVSKNENGAANPVIKDTVPAHMEYVSHFPRDVFDKPSVSGGTLTLASSRDRYEMGPNDIWSIDITFRILSTAPPGSKLCNSAEVKSLGDSAITIDQSCVTVEQQAPQPACVALRLISGSGDDTRRSFEAEVIPDGAIVESYLFNYGDGTTETVSSSASRVTTTHDYSSAGSYSASVTVNTSAGQVGGSGSCAKQINVDETPAPQSTELSCAYFNIISVNQRFYDFEAAAEAEGVTVATFRFDFGDGASAEVASNDNKATVSHNYSQPGDYTAEAFVIDNEGNEVTSTSCQINIEIETIPCPYDSSLAVDDEDCRQAAGSPNIVKQKRARNLTQEIDNAHNTTARAGDIIEYQLITENDGNAVYEDFVVKETFGDVLQYANVVDLDGGSLNQESYLLSWPAENIGAGETITKTVTVRIKSPIPQTPISVSDANAYDLRMENVYGNNVTVKLPKSPAKTVESASRELPNTGPGSNMVVSSLFIGMVSYFYFRNRLISKELKMIKREFSGAGL